MALVKAITMTTLQKAVVGAVLAVGIGGVWYQAQEAARLRRRLATVESASQQQAQQLDSQRDQLAAKVVALSAESERSQSNLAEMVRLRAELARLRATRQENLAAKPAAELQATPQPTKLQIPKDTWADAGLETPEAALKTRGWCVVNGNRERFKESVFVTDDARKMLEDMLVQMAEQSKDPHKDQMIQMVLEHKLGVEEGILMPMMAENQQVGYAGYEVLSDRAASEDERLLQVQTTLANGNAKQENLKLHRFGTDWKIVIDEDFVRAAH
jgi:TolA-binding protein